MVSMPPYVIEPPDELEISVRPAAVEMPLTTVTVQADGVVDLGFVGDVYLAGLTLAQAEQKIAEHLEPIARREAGQASRSTSRSGWSTAAEQVYYVIGAVTTQGRFPIVGNETVLDAMLAAGLRSNSQPEKRLPRPAHPPNGQDQILKIDWDGIKNRGDTMTNYQIFPGDRLIVPGGRPACRISLRRLLGVELLSDGGFRISDKEIGLLKSEPINLRVDPPASRRKMRVFDQADQRCRTGSATNGDLDPAADLLDRD